MTQPTSDEELREALVHLNGLCLPTDHKCTYESTRNDSQILDETMKLIKARDAAKERAANITGMLLGKWNAYDELLLNESIKTTRRKEVEARASQLKASYERRESDLVRRNEKEGECESL